MSETIPFWLAGRPVLVPTAHEVGKKAWGVVPGQASPPESPAFTAAVDAASRAVPLPAHLRASILRAVADSLLSESRQFADLICGEVGKPIRDARTEVDRAVTTLRASADEATRTLGQVLPCDTSPRGEGYRALTKRVPIGVVAAITPFNFPLNLVAHKVGPAIAAGCPFILKPASTTPLVALRLGELLARTELPLESWSILPANAQDTGPLVSDARVRMLSFTGSKDVGYTLAARAAGKKVVLELGGNAACVVDETADWVNAVPRILAGAFAQSGQSCVSVQRIFLHQRIYDEAREQLVAQTRALKLGSPRDEATAIGPLICEADAERLQAWIESAVQRGARILCGGHRDGAYLEPTLLEGVPDDEPLACEEAFGPVAVLDSFHDVNEALARVNRSRFGLQASLFTQRMDRALSAWDTLAVGGVLINEVPSFRLDHLPYGGVKESGLGREGVQEAVASMTEPRLLLIRG